MEFEQWRMGKNADDVKKGTIVDDLGSAVDPADGRAIAYSLGHLFRHGGPPPHAVIRLPLSVGFVCWRG